MISLYRISSARFPANSGEGAAKYGGRWNRAGTAVIYAAQTASLAALEVLVHYSVLPKDHLLTEIQVPESVSFLRLEEESLPEGWKCDTPAAETQDIGEKWVLEKQYAILSVPSSIIPGERNFVLNPGHAAFPEIQFQPSLPFYFDPRLKR